MRILLVDDHVLFRKGLAALLAPRREFAVVGEAGDGLEAIAQARQSRPDVILMDIQMPKCDGLEALRIIKQQMPEIQVVMLTVAEDDQDLFEAIKAGATGYLPKNLDPHELFDMLARAGRGEAAIKPALAFKILREFRQLSGDSTQGEDAKSRLTSREIQVLELVVRGATNKSIAETLCISVNTVKTHLRSILGKLQLNNRTEMAAYALAEGLVGFRPSSPQDTSPPPDPGY